MCIVLEQHPGSLMFTMLEQVSSVFDVYCVRTVSRLFNVYCARTSIQDV